MPVLISPAVCVCVQCLCVPVVCFVVLCFVVFNIFVVFSVFCGV